MSLLDLDPFQAQISARWIPPPSGVDDATATRMAMNTAEKIVSKLKKVIGDDVQIQPNAPILDKGKTDGKQRRRTVFQVWNVSGPRDKSIFFDDISKENLELKAKFKLRYPFRKRFYSYSDVHMAITPATQSAPPSDLRIEIAQLRREKIALQEQNEQLRTENEQLRAENEQLRTENEQLRAQVIELQDQVWQLERDKNELQQQMVQFQAFKEEMNALKKEFLEFKQLHSNCRK